MKNRFLALILGLLIVPTYALAQVGGGGGVSSPSYMRPSSSSGLIPTTGFNELGTSSTRWSKGYFTDFDISGVLTFGGTMGGNFDLTANDLLHVDSIFGSTAILPVRIGDAATSSRGLVSEDDLLVTGKVEIDGLTEHEGVTNFRVATTHVTDAPMQIGSGAVSNIIYKSAQTPDALMIGTGAASNSLIISEIADQAYDFAHALQTNPSLFLQSANQSATEWMSLAHDQTDGRIVTGAGNLSIGTGSDSHSLSTPNDLFVSGRLEVDGRSDFDGNVWFNAGGVNLSTNMDVSNDIAIKNVSNQGGIYPLRTAQTPDASELVTGSLSNAWHLMEYADGTFDFAFPIQTNPTFVYHSANQSTTEWGSLAHDQTNFVINTGAGGVSIPVRFLQTQGPDIPSASTLSVDGSGNLFQNIFELTGTTAVNLIDSTGLTEGSKITLICNESVTINHGTATSGSNITILLAGSANFSCTANDTLTLMLSSTTAGGQAWREIARTAI